MTCVSCVHGAQDADILPRLSLLHSQSHITSALKHLGQLRLLFHGGGAPVRDKRDNETSKPREICNNETPRNDVQSS